MNPWEIFGWVAAGSLSVVVASIAVALTVQMLRSLGRTKSDSTHVIGGDR